MCIVDRQKLNLTLTFLCHTFIFTQFSQVASRRSTCPSKSNGGSLGTFTRGEMVPEFDAVAFGEDIGVIHGPVETQFGSHLILVTGRK